MPFTLNHVLTAVHLLFEVCTATQFYAKALSTFFSKFASFSASFFL
jgi:hypothetical protein